LFASLLGGIPNSRKPPTITSGRDKGREVKRMASKVFSASANDTGKDVFTF
jgi:hypothetical protein